MEVNVGDAGRRLAAQAGHVEVVDVAVARVEHVEEIEAQSDAAGELVASLGVEDAPESFVAATELDDRTIERRDVVDIRGAGGREVAPLGEIWTRSSAGRPASARFLRVRVPVTVTSALSDRCRVRSIDARRSAPTTIVRRTDAKLTSVAVSS